MRLPRTVVAAVLAASMLAAAGPPAAAGVAAPDPESPPAESAAAPDTAPPVLTLAHALTLAESYNPGLRLAALQVTAARSAMGAAPANAQALAPAVSAYLQAQYGISVPAQAISPRAAGQQARVSYEQAAAQYYEARQQVRAGALQAYVEWQKAVATVAAQQAALDRTLTQEANVTAAVTVGAAAPYDLLQIQAAVAGQQAALIGAQAMEVAARTALGQVIGIPVADGVQPEANQVTSAEVQLPDDPEQLIAAALANRPDLRRSALDLTSRRLQAQLAGGGYAAMPQVQAMAGQYELDVAKARTQVTQAYLAAQGALGELRARETALAPAQEALRLAELRYDAGIATWVEVQSASAAALEAEAGRIQASANLMLRLLELRQAIGDL